MEEEVTIKLELTVNEINMALSALGEQPFKAVAGVIGAIRQQAAPQLQAMQATQATETEATEG